MKKAANRPGDRRHIIESGKCITEAQNELKRLQIDRRLAVRSTADRLADIVSGDWLRYHFDGPSRTSLTRYTPRSVRDPDGEMRNMEKRSNHYFIRDRALETLQALLRDLKSVLASALASLDADPQARGGLKPLPWRDNAIINLANIWHGIGKKVVVTPKSDFAEFCQYVFGAMGWPTDGLVSAIPDAVKKWRNHPKKFARLSK